MHAETVLLVDHRERQVVELHLLLEQGVGADRQRRFAASQALQRGVPRLALVAPGQELDGDPRRLGARGGLRSGQAVAGSAGGRRALAWFAGGGMFGRAGRTDNGSGYRSGDFARACLTVGVRHRRTRPYRPQTNGKVERFNRTLLEEWAYVRVYRSEQARTAALARWLHQYNHHRGHTALGGLPPVSRVTNVPAQYT